MYHPLAKNFGYHCKPSEALRIYENITNIPDPAVERAPPDHFGVFSGGLGRPFSNSMVGARDLCPLDGRAVANQSRHLLANQCREFSTGRQ